MANPPGIGIIYGMNHVPESRYGVIHYHQLLNGEISPELSDFLEVRLSENFIRKELNRAEGKYRSSRKASQVYLYNSVRWQITRTKMLVR